jgi:hypothetical protein
VSHVSSHCKGMSTSLQTLDLGSGPHMRGVAVVSRITHRTIISVVAGIGSWNKIARGPARAAGKLPVIATRVMELC